MIMLAYLNNSLPEPISEMFRQHVPVGTRVARHFNVPFAATNYRAFSLSHSAPHTWNSIVVQLFGNIDSVPRNKFTVKKHLKKYFMDRYNV